MEGGKGSGERRERSRSRSRQPSPDPGPEFWQHAFEHRVRRASREELIDLVLFLHGLVKTLLHSLRNMEREIHEEEEEEEDDDDDEEPDHPGLCLAAATSLPDFLEDRGVVRLSQLSKELEVAVHHARVHRNRLWWHGHAARQ